MHFSFLLHIQHEFFIKTHQSKNQFNLRYSILIALVAYYHLNQIAKFHLFIQVKLESFILLKIKNHQLVNKLIPMYYMAY